MAWFENKEASDFKDKKQGKLPIADKEPKSKNRKYKKRHKFILHLARTEKYQASLRDLFKESPAMTRSLLRVYELCTGHVSFVEAERVGRKIDRARPGDYEWWIEELQGNEV